MPVIRIEIPEGISVEIRKPQYILQYLGAEISFYNIGDHDELGMKVSGLSIGAIGYYPFADKFSLLSGVSNWIVSQATLDYNLYLNDYGS